MPSVRSTNRQLVVTTVLALVVLAGLFSSSSTLSGRALQIDSRQDYYLLWPRQRDFELMVAHQVETDRAWRDASVGYMRMEKIVYRSRAGGLEIPAFLF